MQIITSIQNRIYEIRGERIILDFDIAALYEVPTKVLNQAVKRNSERFPGDFMFQLTSEEYDEIQLILANRDSMSLRSQIVTLKSGRGQHRKYLPYAFTEQGVAMLSGVLKSEKAVVMHIAIMRAFVELRKLLLRENDFAEQLTQLKERLGGHDVQLNQIYDALENLLDEKAAGKKWEQRQRIGFKQ